MFTLFCASLSAQYNKINVDLTNSNVNDALKSSDGLLWVATQEGLNVFYDDQSEVFYSKIEDSLSVLNSDILNLDLGFSNEIIASSKSGLSIFNKQTFSFLRIPLKSVPTKIVKDNRSKKIWVTTSQSGIYLFDESFKLESHFEFDPLNPLSISTSRFDEEENSAFYFKENSSRVFIATQNGLNVYDQKLKTFKRYFKGEKTQFTTNNILNVYSQGANQIGIVTQNEFIIFDTQENTFEKVYQFDTALSSAYFISGQQIILNSKDQSFSFSTTDKDNIIFKPLLYQKKTILVDQFSVEKSGAVLLWKKGENSLFSSNSLELNLRESKILGSINSIQQSSLNSQRIIGTDNGIHISTDNTYLVQNLEENRTPLYFSIFDKNYVEIFENSIEVGQLDNGSKKTEFKENYEYNFIDYKFEKSGNYLILGNEHLMLFDLKNKTLTENALPKAVLKKIKIDNIKAIEDEIFLSYSNGIAKTNLSKLKAEKKSIEDIRFFEYNALLNSNLSRGFYDIEKIGEEYFVSDNRRGLIVFKDNLGNFSESFEYNGDPTKTLASSTPTKLFYNSNENILYIGTTGSGLFLFNLTSKRFEKFTADDGLLSNNILDFAQIGNRLFIQTISGINYLENKIIKNINEEDGLTITSYHRESIHAFNEKVILTGYDAYQFFNLNELENQIHPFSISVFNVIRYNKENEQNTLPIQNGNLLNFDYKTNTLLLDLYANTDYKSDQISYYFKRGDNAQEISNGYNNKIQLSSFPYYSSEVEIHAVNGNNQKSQNTLVFNIYNAPPWWLRVETIVFYIIFAIGLVYTLVKLREAQTKKRIESERKSKELEEARELQNSLLPKTNPNVEGYQISTYLKSATEIGGDYYDFFYKKDEYFYAICGDATGHGVISGIMVSVTKAGLNGIPMGSPSKILQQLNRIVKRVNFGRLRMSLTVAKLEQDSIELSSAAMPPTYYYNAKKNKIEEILVPNLPLGGIESEKYDGVKIDFKEGDVVVMISDGLPELPNPKNELLDYEKVEECFRNHSKKDAESIKNALVELSDGWANGVMNPDDITIVVIKKAA